jgi:EAL domain-containing protein (putative c-di-GMP-specific phosphodiesterase class I)
VISPSTIIFETIQKSIKTDSDGWFYAEYDGYQLRSVFQPIFNHQLKVTAYESLVRIKDPAGVAVRPDIFFKHLAFDQIKEEIVVLTCKQIHLENFVKLGLNQQDKKIYINIPPRVFEDKTAGEPGRIRRFELLKRIGIKPSLIVCELLEFPTNCLVKAQFGIKLVRETGARVALDDYGSGACDLKRVKLLNPDIVKIDKSLVQRFEQHEQEIVALVDYCRLRRIKLIAEGVETQAQLDYFINQQIAGFQGYYLSMPKSPAELLDEQVEAFDIPVVEAGTDCQPRLAY